MGDYRDDKYLNVNGPVRGWVFALIDSHLNGPHETEKALPSIRTTAVIAKRWDGKINSRSRLLIQRTANLGEEYAVWVVDCAAVHDLTGSGWDHGWRVSYCAKSRTFGGSAHWDTWQEAIRDFDELRGAAEEQMNLFGSETIV